MLEFTAILVLLMLVALGIATLLHLQGGPYVPSDDKTTQTMVKLAMKYNAKHALDMGSGDGKLVIALAKAGIKAHGVEINPLLVFKSQKEIKTQHLEKLATISWGNMWKINLASYDLLVLYIIKHAMPRLEKKVLKEAKPGTKILSNFFAFPSLASIGTDGKVVIYEVAKKTSR